MNSTESLVQLTHTFIFDILLISSSFVNVLISGLLFRDPNFWLCRWFRFVYRLIAVEFFKPLDLEMADLSMYWKFLFYFTVIDELNDNLRWWFKQCCSRLHHWFCVSSSNNNEQCHLLSKPQLLSMSRLELIKVVRVCDNESVYFLPFALTRFKKNYLNPKHHTVFYVKINKSNGVVLSFQHNCISNFTKCFGYGYLRNCSYKAGHCTETRVYYLLGRLGGQMETSLIVAEFYSYKSAWVDFIQHHYLILPHGDWNSIGTCSTAVWRKELFILFDTVNNNDKLLVLVKFPKLNGKWSHGETINVTRNIPLYLDLTSGQQVRMYLCFNIYHGVVVLNLKYGLYKYYPNSHQKKFNRKCSMWPWPLQYYRITNDRSGNDNTYQIYRYLLTPDSLLYLASRTFYQYDGFYLRNLCFKCLMECGLPKPIVRQCQSSSSKFYPNFALYQFVQVFVVFAIFFFVRLSFFNCWIHDYY